MKYRVSYSALAYKDLRSIYGYISTKLKAPDKETYKQK